MLRLIFRFTSRSQVYLSLGKGYHQPLINKISKLSITIKLRRINKKENIFSLFLKKNPELLPHSANDFMFQRISIYNKQNIIKKKKKGTFLVLFSFTLMDLF